MALLINDIKNELQFVGRYWRMSGRPTVCILVREEHMRDMHFKEMLDLFAMLKKGRCDNLKIRMGRLQNLISSSCIEHLDFLHLLPSEALPKVEAFQQLQHASLGYQSLTDVPKAMVYSEPNYNYDEFETKPIWEVVDALRQTDTLNGQSQLLGILWKRESQHFLIDGVTLKEKLEKLARQSGALRHWCVVRRCSSILCKLVDSISPYITSTLVNAKQITVGVFGQDEVVINHPLTPKEVKEIVYHKCHYSDPYQAVLQQEIIVYIGRLISTTPQLFTGILKLRIGWIIQAMTLYLSFVEEDPTSLESLSPSEVRKVLQKVLSLKDACNDKMTIHQRRQIEGALCRVPKNFYDRVWGIMSRTTGGIVVAGQHLPQQPTLTDMTRYEMNFALKVEQLLRKVSHPEYRQVMVELIMVVSVILQRNPEVSFQDKVDLDQLIHEAFIMFQKDKLSETEEKSDDMSRFYESPSTVTAGYLARAVLNSLLKNNLQHGEIHDTCQIS